MNNGSNFLQVFEALNELRNSIINSWEQKLRLKLKSAQDKPTTVLVHYLPTLLDNLTKVFQNHGHWDEINEHDIILLNKTHGEQRANETNFSLEELLIEFSLLRETIIDHLYPLVTPELETAKIIHRFLDRSLQGAISEYERLQNEKISSQRDNLELEKSLRQRFIVALTHDLRTPSHCCNNDC